MKNLSMKMEKLIRFEENSNCQSKDIRRHSLLIEITVIAMMMRDFENEYSLCV
jgi:hypothetical protein